MNAEETTRIAALSVPRPERFTGEPRLAEYKNYTSATWQVEHTTPEGFAASETWLCSSDTAEPLHWIGIRIVGKGLSCVDIQGPEDPAAAIEAAVAFLRSVHG